MSTPYVGNFKNPDIVIVGWYLMDSMWLKPWDPDSQPTLSHRNSWKTRSAAVSDPVFASSNWVFQYSIDVHRSMLSNAVRAVYRMVTIKDTNKQIDLNIKERRCVKTRLLGS